MFKEIVKLHFLFNVTFKTKSLFSKKVFSNQMLVIFYVCGPIFGDIFSDELIWYIPVYSGDGRPALFRIQRQSSVKSLYKFQVKNFLF